MKHTLAMVGFGGMAGWHYELIQSIEDLTVAGIWDIKESRREYAKSKGIHVYESREDLLADESVDIVLIATPNDVHKEIAIAAMEAGKNVVSEKPVTLCSADLKEMIEASERTGKFFTVHQNRRWDGDFLTVKETIESGKLGEVFKIESRVHGSRGIPGDWRGEKEHGGGMVLDWGVHLLDQALLFFPGVKLNTVYATLDNVTNQLVDDGFMAILGFENGVTMHIEVGTSNFISLPRWYVLGQDGTGIIRDWGNDIEIVRALGVDEGDVVPIKTAAGLTKTMAPRRDDSIHKEQLPEVKSDIRDFYKNVMGVLDGKAERIIKLEEVARVMRLMEAIFESAATKKVIEFEK